MLVTVGLFGKATSPSVVSGGSCFMAVGLGLVGPGSFSKRSVGVSVAFLHFGRGHDFIILG